MKKVIHDKRVEYSLFLNKQLSKNEDRIQVEKFAVEKLQTSFKGLSDTFRAELDSQLDIIQREENLVKKQEEELKKAEETGTKSVSDQQ